jgi:hypothetical protein
MTVHMPATARAALPKQIGDLILYSDQLAAILVKETAGLQARDKSALTVFEAEKARVMALYQRELNALRKDPNWAKALPAPVRDALAAAGARLGAALKSQSALIARRRHVTEGIVQAIAKEVAVKRQGVTPYAKPNGARLAPAAPRAATAITLNSVV